MSYSTPAVLVSLSAAISATVSALHQKGVISKSEVNAIAAAARKSALGAAPGLEAEVNQIFDEIFPGSSADQ